MNVLFIADYFLPHAGGSRVYYHNLYSGMTSEFHDHLTILTKKVPGWREFDSAISNESIEIVRNFKPLPNLRLQHLPKIVFALSSTLRQLIRHSVDIIHAGDLYPQGVVARWIKDLFGIPYVAFCHGEDITQSDRYRYQPIVRDWIYQGADGVVAACEFARQNLLRIGVDDKRITKITPGVDCRRFSPRPARQDLIEQYGLAGREVVLTVARLFPRKGHEAVIRAIAKIAQKHPKVAYLIVGIGPERQRLETLVAQLGLGTVVKFAGYVAEECLADMYSLCDVFVMPNHEDDKGDIEGFGMVFLEANAAGKPVIAGRSGGTADSVIDGITGYRVDPNNIEELTCRLDRLLTDPGLCDRLGQAGMRRAREGFAWSTRAHQLRQLSAEIVEKTQMRARKALAAEAR